MFAAEALGESDLVDQAIRSEQNWGMMPAAAVLSCVYVGPPDGLPWRRAGEVGSVGVSLFLRLQPLEYQRTPQPTISFRLLLCPSPVMAQPTPTLL